ncbi:hypothetical protein [Streptomyces meridianus]|uniref:Cytochrome C oxidase subunit I n=1 Tax=Streptomyces meridianus TaxID=2938945 RepID=A0ABT0X9I0_9ACTN|nr:hypothetical protein [Streptomyces meridianus]MCM2578434.1 hypothetical protein [Streptomyces meridianus]
MRGRPEEGTDDFAQGLAKLEGYLLCHAERSSARARAEAFARRMPWLTRAQHDEVVRLYTEDHMEVTREKLRAIEKRCRELRGEYGDRYAELRRRLLCTGAVLVLSASALCVCTVPFARLGV